VTVTVYESPVADTGEDILLYNQQEATLNGSLANEYESGTWSVISGTGELADSSLPNTTVSNLSQGENIILWKVTNGICPESFDTVRIIVNDLEIQTLMTPNMDGRNDYFIVKGLNTLENAELTVFDRRGVQVYKNRNYDNLWNGVDYNENPLHDDTYFYVIRTESGKSISGFIVIRR
jgi:gliding motility-associated-like protein